MFFLKLWRRYGARGRQIGPAPVAVLALPPLIARADLVRRTRRPVVTAGSALPERIRTRAGWIVDREDLHEIHHPECTECGLTVAVTGLELIMSSPACPLCLQCRSCLSMCARGQIYHGAK